MRKKIFGDQFMEESKTSAGPGRICKLWIGRGSEHGF